MHHIPILVAFAVVFLVIYIVTRPGNSFISRATGWISNMVEGFATSSPSVPRCPAGYKFFNDAVGESFCCNGTINPYTHTCTGGSGVNPVCAFKPGVKKSAGGGIYPLCSALIAQNTETIQKESCPTRLPNYASVGKCCMHATDLDGVDCTSIDAPTTNYCKLKGPLKPGEQLCSNVQLREMASCPAGLAPVGYKLGDAYSQREVAKYGEVAKNVVLPVCFSMEQSCIPNNVIGVLQAYGIYKDKPSNWLYNCDNYTKRYINRDLSTKMDESYP